MKVLKSNILFFIFLSASLTFFVACKEKEETSQERKLSQTISVEEANELEEYYKRTRSTILNDTLGFEDTREFWFSLETLKDYIAFVEREAAKTGKTNLGMRIYLGAYPEDSSYPDAKYTTVFLVPTAPASQNPLKKGFFPIQEENENLNNIPPLNFGHGGKPPKDY